jgi:hypothetical protein
LLQCESFRRIERLQGENCDIAVSGFDEVRFERQAQARIDNGAKQFSATRLAGAVGHSWIICENRPDACKERVGFMTELLDGVARDFTGDPSSASRARRDLAVEGERGFQGDEGQASANPFGEIFVELAGGGFLNVY